MWNVILDAVLDTLKILPLLLIVYIIIEIIEANSASRLKLNRLFGTKLAPLFGAAVGIVPQCGFSVVATNLYAKKTIKLGTLIAVFVATSDEAVPILLSTPGAAIKLLPLLGLKFAFAVIAGYAVNFFMRKQTVLPISLKQTEIQGCHGHTITLSGDNDDSGVACDSDKNDNTREDEHSNEQRQTDVNVHSNISEKTNGHEQEDKHAHAHGDGNKTDWAKRYVLHPLLHTLTVIGYIFAVNLILGTIIFFVGQARLESALQSGYWFQPIVAALVGLIPNCASSVVISQLYAGGALSLGAAFAGLAANAGLGLAVLFKQNKNLKENLMIVLGLFLGSAAVGMLLSFLPF